jgi:hypothetical protein
MFRPTLPRLEVLEGREVPATFLVTNLNDSGPGSFRAALAAANDELANPGEDTITFADSTDQGFVRLLSPLPVVNTDLVVDAISTVGNELYPSLDAQGQFRVLQVAAGKTVVLSGVDILNGETVAGSPTSPTVGDGAGILNFGTLTLDRSLVRGNRTNANGAGVANFGTLTVTASRIGALNVTSLDPDTGRPFANVVRGGGRGGGIYNAGTLTVNRTQINNKNDNGAGSGIFSAGGVVRVEASFIDDRGYSGSSPDNFLTGAFGVVLQDATATLVNSTLYGVRVVNGSARLDFVTISGEEVVATYNGPDPGADYGLGLTVAGSAGVTVNNSIISANKLSINGVLTTVDVGVAETATLGGSDNVIGTLNGAVVPADQGGSLQPLLAALPTVTGESDAAINFVRLLQLNSPALNSGTANAAVQFDQRGLPRPTTGAVDAGAVQIQPPTTAPDGSDAAPFFTAQADSSSSVPAANGVLNNDTLVDGVSKTAVPGSVSNLVNLASVILNPDGSFTAVPMPGMAGPASFTYTAQNEYGRTSGPTRVTGVIQPPDRPTLRLDGIVPGDRNRTVTGVAEVRVFGTARPRALTAEDFPPEAGEVVVGVPEPVPGDPGLFRYPFTFTAVGPARPGVVLRFTFQDSFGSPNQGGAVDYRFDIGSPSAPVARPDRFNTLPNQPVSGTVRGQGDGADDVPDGATFAVASGPDRGRLSAFNADGTFTYVPATDDPSPATFRYALTAPGARSEADVTITIGETQAISPLPAPVFPAAQFALPVAGRQTLRVPAGRGLLTAFTDETQRFVANAPGVRVTSPNSTAFPVTVTGVELEGRLGTVELVPLDADNNPADGIARAANLLIDPATGAFNYTPPAGTPGGAILFRYRLTDTSFTSPPIIARVDVPAPLPFAPRTRLIAVGAGAGVGSTPIVWVYDAKTRLELFRFQAFESSFTGGVRVAVADVNQDGIDDIVCVPGPGGGPRVTFIDGASRLEVVGGQPILRVPGPADAARPAFLYSFFAFEEELRSGLHIAAGNPDDKADENGFFKPAVIAVAPGSSLDSTGAPRVVTYRVEGFTPFGPDGRSPDSRFTIPEGKSIYQIRSVAGGPDGSSLGNRFVFEQGFRGGVRLAVAQLDANEDTLEVVTVPGPSGGPRVRIWNETLTGDPRTGDPLNDFFAFDPNYRGGLFVAASDGLVVATQDAAPQFRDSDLDVFSDDVSTLPADLLTNELNRLPNRVTPGTASYTPPPVARLFAFSSLPDAGPTDAGLAATFVQPLFDATSVGGVRVAAGRVGTDRGLLVSEGQQSRDSRQRNNQTRSRAEFRSYTRAGTGSPPVPTGVVVPLADTLPNDESIIEFGLTVATSPLPVVNG